MPNLFHSKITPPYCTVGFVRYMRPYIKSTEQEGHASQHSGGKTRSELPSVQDIYQNVEHLKVEFKLRKPRTAVLHTVKKCFIFYLLNGKRHP